MRMTYSLLLYVLFPLLYPFTNGILPILLKKVRSRKAFEEKNAMDILSRSFKRDGIKAQVVFEVSSEGELEQIRPLLDEYLKRQLHVELVFCSPSVEKNVLRLADQYPANLRILRLPLLTYLPWKTQSFTNWVSAKNFILCRYDFFPELLLYGWRKDVHFQLVSATVKNRDFDTARWPVLSFWRSIFASFDFIVAATQKDKRQLEEKLHIPGKKIDSFDFRLVQVAKRLAKKEEIFALHPFVPTFLEYLSHFPRNSRILFGSFWPRESALFEQSQFGEEILGGRIQVTIVPHDLSHEGDRELREMLKAKTGGRIPIHVLDDQNDGVSFFYEVKKDPGIVILRVRGLLCELYSLFGHAFVGGGHGRSIHSVLEPYVAMGRIYVGPKTHRSTEYDFIVANSPQEIHVFERLEDFYHLFKRWQIVPLRTEVRMELIQQGQLTFQQYISKNLGEWK